jgi:hypothetical protein
VLLQVSGGVSGQSLSFSSYPGELASDDDFYLTSSKLVVLETTNHIYNFTILEVRMWGLGAWHSRPVDVGLVTTAHEMCVLQYLEAVYMAGINLTCCLLSASCILRRPM